MKKIYKKWLIVCFMLCGAALFAQERSWKMLAFCNTGDVQYKSTNPRMQLLNGAAVFDSTVLVLGVWVAEEEYQKLSNLIQELIGCGTQTILDSIDIEVRRDKDTDAADEASETRTKFTPSDVWASMEGAAKAFKGQRAKIGRALVKDRSLRYRMVEDSGGFIIFAGSWGEVGEDDAVGQFDGVLGGEKVVLFGIGEVQAIKLNRNTLWTEAQLRKVGIHSMSFRQYKVMRTPILHNTASGISTFSYTLPDGRKVKEKTMAGRTRVEVGQPAPKTAAELEIERVAQEVEQTRLKLERLRAEQEAQLRKAEEQEALLRAAYAQTLQRQQQTVSSSATAPRTMSTAVGAGAQVTRAQDGATVIQYPGAPGGIVFDSTGNNAVICGSSYSKTTVSSDGSKKTINYFGPGSQ